MGGSHNSFRFMHAPSFRGPYMVGPRAPKLLRMALDHTYAVANDMARSYLCSWNWLGMIIPVPFDERILLNLKNIDQL